LDFTSEERLYARRIDRNGNCQSGRGAALARDRAADPQAQPREARHLRARQSVYALIKSLHADPDFLTFPTTREEEALGIVSGAWMGGRRGAVLMQTSGFGTIPNVLASLVVPYQVPRPASTITRGSAPLTATRCRSASAS
jgi:hypothetical protein